MRIQGRIIKINKMTDGDGDGDGIFQMIIIMMKLDVYLQTYLHLNVDLLLKTK